MAYVNVAPQWLVAAASDMEGIGSTLTAANSVAAARTTAVVAAANDEVSTAIAALFSGHGQAFEALSARAAAFHAQFAQALNRAGAAYGAAEAANATPLDSLEQSLQSLAFSPVQEMTGRPLFGNGADAAPGSGQAGGDAGWLFGNGGNGGSGAPAPAGQAGQAGGAGGSCRAVRQRRRGW